jgi:hypothetical protein
MKHVVTLTTSNPAHEHVSLRRRQSTTNFMVEAADEQTAILRATAHFKRLGHYIHEAKIYKKKDQLNEISSLVRLGANVVKAAPSVLKLADDAVEAAKQVATRTRQVGTHSRETNIGSVIPGPISTKGKELVVVKPTPAAVKTAPLPVKLPTPVPAPVKNVPVPVKPAPAPAPTKTLPVPSPVKPMNPLAAAATLATGLLALKQKGTSDIVPQTDDVTEPQTQTQTQTQTSGVQPPPPTKTQVKPGGRPRVAVLPSLSLRLGDRGEEDIRTLGQYRGLARMYQFHDFNSNNGLQEVWVQLEMPLVVFLQRESKWQKKLPRTKRTK